MKTVFILFQYHPFNYLDGCDYEEQFLCVFSTLQAAQAYGNYRWRSSKKYWDSLDKEGQKRQFSCTAYYAIEEFTIKEARESLDNPPFCIRRWTKDSFGKYGKMEDLAWKDEEEDESCMGALQR